MWSPLVGLDMFFKGLVEDLAFMDESEAALGAAIEAVIEGRGLWGPVGMRGPLGELLEEAAISPVIGSIWAEVGWRLGWLQLEATASPSEFDEASQRLETAAVDEMRGADALSALGVASMEGRHWLALASEDGRWLYVDLDTWEPPSDEHPHGRYVDIDEARIRWVRLPTPRFSDGLLIGAGSAQQAAPSESVWIFHGDDAKHAAGVFASEADAAAWVGSHQLSGVLTEYPVGEGCYDAAVRGGHFRPTKPHHGSPAHIASFSPGWTRHVHFRDGVAT